MKNFTFSIICFSFITFTCAEELIIKHGGTVKSSSSTILEVVQDRDRTNIYITPRGQKNMMLKLTITLPGKTQHINYDLK